MRRDCKSQFLVAAQRENLVLPPQFGSEYFQQDSNVIVQLVNSEGTCWTSELAPEHTKKNEVNSFKAKAR